MKKIVLSNGQTGINRHLSRMLKQVLCGLLLPFTICELAYAVDSGMATVTVYPDVLLGQVNRLILGAGILGHNEKYFDQMSNRGAGVWDLDKRAPTNEYVALAKDAGISVFRWRGGGNETGPLDWKKTVGPLSERQRKQFGLSEYLRFCAEVGAIPLINVEAAVGTPKDAADLVEYLNSPNDGSNPNGGVDWASQRTKDGRNEPWNVVWFEFGNETFYTNMPVGEYVERYRQYQSAMKAVDRKVKLGAVLEDSTNIESGWTYSVLSKLGDQIDFGIIHPYILNLKKDSAKAVSKEIVALAAVSSDADLIYRFNRYQELIRKTTPAGVLPLAVTEYNGLFVQDEPIPYRHTLVNALHNADHIRVMLNPEFHIALASCWHYSNGYWGTLSGYPHKGEKIVKQPNYYVLSLYNKYLGESLLKLDIDSKGIDFKGALDIGPRMGAPSGRQSLPYDRPLPAEWERRYFSDGNQSQKDGVISVEFNKGVDTNYLHATKEIDAEPNTLYEVAVRMRTHDLKGGKIGIEVQDARGWKKTYSAAKNITLTGTTPWTWVTTEYRTLTDVKKIRILARRYSGSGPVSGRAEFGEMRVTKIKQNLGSVSSVTGIASASADKKNIFVVVINKNLYEPVEVSIKISGNYQADGAESLTGPTPFATNQNPTQSEMVAIMPASIRQKNAEIFVIKLPAASVSGLAFKKQ